MTGRELAVEPDIKMALGWWSELPEKWTPIGWKHHLFRFNVLFNGTLSALPDLNPRKNEEGQGVQLGFWPSSGPSFPDYSASTRDNNSAIQGWNACAAPVLWTEWAPGGLVMRQEVFAHVPGGKEVKTGVEPLFAWVRLSVHDTVQGLQPPETYGFSVKINARCIAPVSMSIRHNLDADIEHSAYPRRLFLESEGYDPTRGLRLLEEGGKVRLAVAPGQECKVQLLEKQPTELDSLLYIRMDARKGALVDLLVPMLTTDRKTFDAELAIGYDRALDEANRFWAVRPATAARFDTPEDYVDEAIRRNIMLAEVISETNPATGITSMLSCSWSDTVLWSTPGSLTYIMLLDSFGYHELVEKYIRMYKAEQGQRTPPGDYFTPNPGALTSPRSLSAIDWVTDHGALLWMISEHGLLTGDKQFIEEWTPVIVKACEFIKDARRITGHKGVPGLLPPARATDAGSNIQSVWSDGWNYKGLYTAAKLLERMNHPRAKEFAAEAEDYRKTFVAALRAATATMPEWKDDAGGTHHFVPYSVSGTEMNSYRHGFYLDVGPLFLVWAGLVDANDEMMRSTLLWFRDGPPSKVYRYDSDCWQVASLHHEMSSCEPSYSWNVFHSHQLGDRARFLEGMYSLFAGQMSRQTFTACETRGGMTGTTWGYLPIYLARLAVVDDQIKQDELHLLRMMPLAWLRTGRESRFENIPTEFGPVSLRAGLSRDGRELQVTFSSEFRIVLKRVVVHVPPVNGLRKISVNGRDAGWDGQRPELEIGAAGRQSPLVGRP